MPKRRTSQNNTHRQRKNCIVVKMMSVAHAALARCCGKPSTHNTHSLESKALRAMIIPQQHVHLGISAGKVAVTRKSRIDHLPFGREVHQKPTDQGISNTVPRLWLLDALVNQTWRTLESRSERHTAITAPRALSEGGSMSCSFFGLSGSRDFSKFTSAAVSVQLTKHWVHLGIQEGLLLQISETSSATVVYLSDVNEPWRRRGHVCRVAHAKYTC